MASQTITNTYISTSSVSIPDNATNVQISIRGGSGGNGGRDGGADGAGGGYSRSGIFKYKNNFVSRNITAVVGEKGGNGGNNVSSSTGGGSRGSSSVARGGKGGNVGSGPPDDAWSGGGGGGGGASAILNNSGTPVIVAGGGGGGGGASNKRDGKKGGNAGGWASSVGSVSEGQDGKSADYDGGGGGGGGGGVPGGSGGSRGEDEDVGGGGGDGGGSGYNSSVFDIVSTGSLDSGNGSISIVYDLWTPDILSFEISPDPQDSNTGIPNDKVTLSWSVANANLVTITDLGTVGTSGSQTVNTGLQSVAGSNSPATKTYILTACAGSVCTTAQVTAQVFNDNTPNSFTIPDQLGKEPNEVLTIQTEQVTGIDMPTFVVCGPGVTVETDGGGFSSQRIITNGQRLRLRVTAEPFNTDENGLVNEKTVYITIGPSTFYFLVQTRAPVIEEIFDFGDNQFAYPYPKVDTRVVGEVIASGGTYQTPQPYLQSPTIVEPSASSWEVELENPYGVQIKAKDIKYSAPNTTSYTNISSQNDTDLEVNVQRQGNQPNNTWTKPNII